MKKIKTWKFVLIIISILSISACELIEEPVFEDTEVTGEQENQENSPE